MPSRVTAPRLTALEVLRAVRSGDLADRALDRRARSLEQREVGWLQELVYGTFRLRGRIDHLLANRVRNGLDSLHPDVLDVLRLGLYQLLEMSSVPPYAAVSQSVDLAREAGHPRAAGLVNGVLQSINRERERIPFPDPAREPLRWLTTWGSHPEWLVERWIARYGVEQTAALVEANNRRPELYIRLVGMEREQAVRVLADAGIVAVPVEISPESLRIESPAGPAEVLALVPAVVQDPAASLVVRYADVPEGALVVDLCAAPGGKAVGLATRARYVAAADLSARRQRRLRENVERLGLAERIGPVVADGRVPPFARADLVLLDAPCTGTGTLRRHPDGRWRLDPGQIERLGALQDELLAAAAELLGPGGVLVYSTCSLEPEENADRVEAFLATQPHFRREPADAAVDPSVVGEHGDLIVLPQWHGVDGAYAARLRRTR